MLLDCSPPFSLSPHPNSLSVTAGGEGVERDVITWCPFWRVRRPPYFLPLSLAPVHRSIKCVCVPRSPGRPCKSAQIERSGKLQRQADDTRTRATGKREVSPPSRRAVPLFFRSAFDLRLSPENDPSECVPLGFSPLPLFLSYFFFSLFFFSTKIANCQVRGSQSGADIKGVSVPGKDKKIKGKKITAPVLVSFSKRKKKKRLSAV